MGGRILFVTSSYPRWADDTTAPFVHHLAVDLRARGWDVRVLAPHAPRAAVREELDGVPVRRFRYLWPESLETVCYDGGALPKLRARPGNWLKLPFLLVAEWLALLIDCRRDRPDVVHSHWLLPQGLAAALAAGPAGAGHVTTAHGSDVFALRGFWFDACRRFVVRRATAVTVNSSATQAAVAKLSPDASGIVRIPMGATVPPPANREAVAALRSQYRRGSGPLLVFVGRLIAQKGADDLLQAMALVRDGLPDVSALIVGAGPERDALGRQARELGLEDCVHFTGWLQTPDVQAALRASDILVAPSKPEADGAVEAQGLSIAEAMLAGVPVIAAGIGGITDAIRDDATGLLVLPGAPADLAAAIRRLAGDASLAQRLAHAAQELASQEFTREVAARRLSELYIRVIEARASKK